MGQWPDSSRGHVTYWTVEELLGFRATSSSLGLAHVLCSFYRMSMDSG